MFCVLYPLEYCRESQLLFCCSMLRPRVRTMARSLAADISGFPCLMRREEEKRREAQSEREMCDISKQLMKIISNTEL